MTQCPTKYTHSQTNQHHVTKVECRLDQAMHTRFEDEVVNRIQEDVECRRCTGIEGGPLPKVVFGIEAKVHHNYRRHAYYQT